MQLKAITLMLVTLSLPTHADEYSTMVQYCEQKGEIYSTAFKFRQANLPMEKVRSIISEVKDKDIRKSSYDLMNKAYSEPVFSTDKIASYVHNKELNNIVLTCYSEHGLL